MSVLELLKVQIEARGRLTYKQFVETALYHPDFGYYRRGKEAGRDYWTSPEMSPVFGLTLASFIEGVCGASGEEQVRLVELGGGQGILAGAILEGLRGLEVESYTIVEHGPEKRTGLVGRVADLSRVAASPVFTVVIAHEFFDALPFHRIVLRQGVVREVYLGWGDGFFETLDAPGREVGTLIEQLELPLSEGSQLEISTCYSPVVKAVSERVETGLFLIFDYGYHHGEIALGRFTEGSVMGYRNFAVTHDLFSSPGSTDITHHVDFDHLSTLLAHNGWEKKAEMSQERFLIRAGVLERLALLEAEARQAAKHVINPEGLASAISALVFTRGGDASLPDPGPRLRG